MNKKKFTAHRHGESRYFYGFKMAASSAWYGQTNFFPMRDNSKILFSSMGFLYPGNSKK